MLRRKPRSSWPCERKQKKDRDFGKAKASISNWNMGRKARSNAEPEGDFLPPDERKLPQLLESYGATLSAKDQHLLGLLKQYEASPGVHLEVITAACDL